MRAMLPCKVKWPIPPSTSQKLEKIAAADKVCLIVLNMCFLDAFPPDDFYQLGIAEIKTLKEFKSRLVSYTRNTEVENRRQKDFEQES